MGDDDPRYGSPTAYGLFISVDNMLFGDAGVRIALGPRLSTSVLQSFVVKPFEARKLADELMRVADEAEKVLL